MGVHEAPPSAATHMSATGAFTRRLLAFLFMQTSICPQCMVWTWSVLRVRFSCNFWDGLLGGGQFTGSIRPLFHGPFSLPTTRMWTAARGFSWSFYNHCPPSSFTVRPCGLYHGRHARMPVGTSPHAHYARRTTFAALLRAFPAPRPPRRIALHAPQRLPAFSPMLAICTSRETILVFVCCYPAVACSYYVFGQMWREIVSSSGQCASLLEVAGRCLSLCPGGERKSSFTTSYPQAVDSHSGVGLGGCTSRFGADSACLPAQLPTATRACCHHCLPPHLG